jgi:hypothetical protein
MTNLLDERIGRHQMYELDMRALSRAFFYGPQYQSIANTIVQLIRGSAWGVIAALRRCPYRFGK